MGLQRHQDQAECPAAVIAPTASPAWSLPTGAKKVTPGVVKNINLPLTVGKVFFRPQGRPRVLHRHLDRRQVQEPGRDRRPLRLRRGEQRRRHAELGVRPGLPPGQRSWGVFVGKTAYTHYDFDNFEDFDRDYAFVTVYNGFSLDSSKQVLKSEYEAWKGEKYTKDKEITKKEFDEGVLSTAPTARTSGSRRTRRSRRSTCRATLRRTSSSTSRLRATTASS